MKPSTVTRIVSRPREYRREPVYQVYAALALITLVTVWLVAQLMAQIDTPQVSATPNAQELDYR